MEDYAEYKLSKEYKDKLDYYRELDKVERLENLPFWQKIICHITRDNPKTVTYDDERELIIVEWYDKYKPKLIINIRGNDIEACTYDVFNQTVNYMRKNY